MVVGVTQQIFTRVKKTPKKQRPLPVRRSRHKIKEGKLKWEESKHRGKEEEALPGRGLDKASLFRLEGPE